MTVYRIIPARSSIKVASFETYNEALQHNRATGLQCKPMRRIEGGRIMWYVPTVATQGLKAKPDYIKLPDWERPAYYF